MWALRGHEAVGLGASGSQGLTQEADTGAGGADTENIQDPKGRDGLMGEAREKAVQAGGLGLN